MDIEITLWVNGTEHRLVIDTRTTLLDALRERLGFTGPNRSLRTTPSSAVTVLRDRSARRLACCVRPRRAGRVRSLPI